MMFSDSVKKLEKSFEDEPQVITPKGQKYEVYVEQQIALLKSCLLEPVQAKVTSASLDQYDFEKYKNNKVWAIARNKSNWLITLEDEQEFALAFGSKASELEMLGFSSSDALAEWLG